MLLKPTNFSSSGKLRLLLSFLILVTICGCSTQTDYFEEGAKAKIPFDTYISEEDAAKDPLILALVICSQPSKTLEGVLHNDLCAIVFQQVAVGWAAQDRKEFANWAFLKSIEYARRTRQKSGSRLRGISESCLDSGCYEEAVEASRYLRVEDRARVLAEVAANLARNGEQDKARELLEEAEDRLQANVQAGGSAKQRAYRAIAVAHFYLQESELTAEAQELGSRFDPTWPPVVAIRNYIEVADMYRQCSQLEVAKKYARRAETLCRKHRDEQMTVLTAALMSRLGEQGTAEALIQKLVGRTRDPAQVAQGYGRIGRPDLALKFLKESTDEVRARGIYLTSSYFETVEDKQSVVALVRNLDAGHKDWQMLQAVADLCARTGDSRRAQRYYLASLAAYQRDWPELWHNSQQRAFVLANYGREMAESDLAADSRSLKLYAGLTKSYNWPQELKL